MNDRVDMVIVQNTFNMLSVANVAFDEMEIRQMLNRREILQRGAIFQIVKANNLICVPVSLEHVPNKPPTTINDQVISNFNANKEVTILT